MTVSLNTSGRHCLENEIKIINEVASNRIVLTQLRLSGEAIMFIFVPGIYIHNIYIFFFSNAKKDPKTDFYRRSRNGRGILIAELLYRIAAPVYALQ